MFWTKSYKRSEEACRIMKEIAEEVLAIHRRSVDNNDAAPTDTLARGSILKRIVEHDYPSDAHRVSEIISFIIAGHETSAFTLCFFLFEMSRNPECLKRVQQELDAAITPESCPDGRPSLAQVSPALYTITYWL